ncbi:hypothetical protein SADUNF_Sadunf09G0118200 [Salix dunnii]|uniref:Uncharacterized protein n=1 Tax=Salix dunnii TaxID=1413687 RepID=A0A835JU54_9ROSI|nr:hypothetical protein SADUNF_Sadunf09G0118200 [Salix dunnii]
MARLAICFLVFVLAIVAEAASDKPKKAKKCLDKKNYPVCFKTKNLYCPPACPRECYVDCATCTPVCSRPPPPPPFLPPPPPPVKPKKAKRCSDKKNYPVCYKTKDLYCPPGCPRECYVDCATCTPVCSKPSPPPPVLSPPPPPVTSTPPAQNPPPPPDSSESAPKRVKCYNKKYTTCYGQEHTCPSACPSQCEVDCTICKAVCNCDRPGAVCQDPRFIGGDGITFYFHGKKDRDFCIVSDSNLHINAHFIGRRNDKMTRDFTWVQSLGILFGTHKLFIGAQKTATWDASIDRLSLALDGEPIYLPDGEGMKWKAEISPSVTITRSSDANAVVIEAEGNFKIKAAVVPITQKDSRIHNYGIDSENCFAHLDLSFKFYTLSGDVNGVLGQTYGSNYVSRVKMGVLMPVLGGEKEFASSNIFATDCTAARFSGQHPITNSSVNFEYANLHCASGIDGRGVVCKR